MYHSSHGVWFKTGQTILFFGNKKTSLEALRKRLSFPLCSLEQIHSDKTFLAQTSKELQGDGHYTVQPHLALAIKTADCIPLFLCCEDILLAIHAGWRGVAQRIVPKALQTIETKYPGIRSQPWTCFIGPHILFNSFEVHQDVAYKILSSVPIKNLKQAQQERLLSPHPQKDKVYLNLKEVQKRQLSSYKIQYREASIDTLTHPEFASYRRDGKKASRNISLIFRRT